MPCGSKDSNSSDSHCAFEDLDHSILQEPLNLGVTNVKQILKCIETGSREIKDIILNECNIIYECKVCVGLFRSLANFMYHKRCYCKKHCCEKMVLFENFEENSNTVVIQPEPPTDIVEKSIRDNALPIMQECTVDLVKADLFEEKVSAPDDTIETVLQELQEPKTATGTSDSQNLKNKVIDDKKPLEVKKMESPMISRRTRDKNSQALHSIGTSKTTPKTISSDEPPAKSAKILSKDINSLKPVKETNVGKSLREPKSAKETVVIKPTKESDVHPVPEPKHAKEVAKSTKENISNPGAVIENTCASGRPKTALKGKITLTKITNAAVKNIQSFPKIIFKTIDGNPHAVFQSAETKKIENCNIKTKCDKTVVHAKAEKEKLIIVLKKDTSAASCVDSKPPQPEKVSNASQKQNEFHLTRRKRLLTRNDCNVHELKCLVCNTQFMSLKTLYFHMLSLHSKKRLYYPCPFCKTLFVQMYGVTRHLISIHNKTKEQINKLRDTIKKKSVWRKVDDTAASNINAQTPQKCENFETGTDPKPEIKNNTFETSQVEGSPIKTVIKLSKNATLHQCSKCNRVFGRKSSQVSHEKFCIMNAIKVETVDLAVQPTSPPPVISLLSLSPNQTCGEQQTSKLQHTIKQPSLDVKISARPKRGAEKQMHKDFVNSQTLKWRSANRVDTNVKAVTSAKKTNGKNLEKRVLSIMNTENLICMKCDKKFSSYSNLRRHVAIHVGWTRFKCKYCEYQAYNKSQCWSHIQKSHAVSEDDMDKSIVNLVGNTLNKKASAIHIAQTDKHSPVMTIKQSLTKSGAIPKMKIFKKKSLNTTTKVTNEKKHANVSKKENVDSKKEIQEIKKDKTQYPVQKYNIPEYKRETNNYKSVTTSNPTTIILSKKIPSSTVQSLVPISPSTMSSSSSKTLPVRSSPRKNESKTFGEKNVTSPVTRSTAYIKSSPIQIKLAGRSSSTDELNKKDSVQVSEKTYAKKERLISEWFPKKDFSANNTRRESAPLIIGLVPASSSGLNARSKNPAISYERNGS